MSIEMDFAAGLLGQASSNVGRCRRGVALGQLTPQERAALLEDAQKLAADAASLVQELGES